MTKTITPSRVRSLQEPSFQHQKVSTIFMTQALSPAGQLSTKTARYATDGSFNHRDGQGHLVR